MAKRIEIVAVPAEPNCLFCGHAQSCPGEHFDGTYFTCDPEAPIHQPGYDPAKDSNRG
jgi:hypothetical protein